MKGRKAPIRIETISAEAADYAGCTVAFVYNPFGSEVLEAFLQRLESTATGERLLLIYANPVHSHVVDRKPWLKLSETFDVPHLSADVKAHVYTRV